MGASLAVPPSHVDGPSTTRFRSFDGFRDQLAAIALDITGSGWSIPNWADAAARFDPSRTQTAGLIDQP